MVDTGMGHVGFRCAWDPGGDRSTATDPEEHP
jgi:hypothetical protein